MFVQNEQILPVNPVQPHNTDTFYRIADYFWAQNLNLSVKVLLSLM